MPDQCQPDRTNESDDLDKILWGAREIAPVIRRSERQVHYLLENGRIDATKTGKIYTSTPRRLRRSLGEVV